MLEQKMETTIMDNHMDKNTHNVVKTRASYWVSRFLGLECLQGLEL